MANSNTNLMSIKPTTGTNSNRLTSQSTSKISNQYKSGVKNSSSDFDKTLNKINARNDNARPEVKDAKAVTKESNDVADKVSQIEEEAKAADAAMKTTSAQGKSDNKTQDAPQNENPETQNLNTEDIPDEAVEGAAEQSGTASFAYLFAGNPETLLAVQNTEVTDSENPNLQAILPQSSDNKAQSMLDRLGGKTWTVEDVKASVVQQNQPLQNLNVEVTPEQLQSPNQSGQVQIQPQFQNQPLQNLNVEVNPEQIQNPNQSGQVQLQPQFQNQPLQNLNVEVNPEQIQNPNQQVQLQPQNQPLQNLNVEVNPEQIQNPNQHERVQIQPQNQNLNTAAQPQIQQTQFGQAINPEINSMQATAAEIEPIHNTQNQNLNQLLGVNVQVEDAEISMPVNNIQPSPEQFDQNSGQNPEQNLTGQSAPQNFEVEGRQGQNSTGGEIFAPQPLTGGDTIQTQPAAQVQNPQAAAQVRDEFNVAGQIVEQARLIRTATNTEMVINLKPEHLGQLTLRISVSQNGALNASFHSDNAQVRAIIENSLVQLKNDLANQGLKVENVQVYSGLSDGGLMNGQGGQAWQQQQQQRNNRGRIDFEAFDDDVDALNPINESNVEDGVDYKV